MKNETAMNKSLTIRVSESDIALIDAWRAKLERESGFRPTRSQAIRGMISVIRSMEAAK